MRAADALVEEIVASSEIPSHRRRRDVARELRAHIDDFVRSARGAGHTDDDIERMVLENFGDPLQIARSFAWVYRRDRALLGFSVFGLSTLCVAAIISAGTLITQAGVASTFGLPFGNMFLTRHTAIEAADILATVAAYLGIISLEKIFSRPSLPKALAVLSGIVAALFGLSLAIHVHAGFLVFGFANAVLLRAVQPVLKLQAARLAVVPLCFGLYGIWTKAPESHYPVANTFASWVVMGCGYQIMTSLAARIDRTLLQTLQRF